MPGIRVTNINLRIVDNGHDRLVAWASCTLEELLRLNNIAVRRSMRSGLLLTYPAKATASGSITHYHPVSREVSQAIEDAIFGKLRPLLQPDRPDD